MSAIFDVHRLAERTTLIIASGELDVVDVKTLNATVAEALEAHQDVVLSLTQCASVDAGALEMCGAIVASLAHDRRFIIAIGDGSALALALAERTFAPPVRYAFTLSAAIRSLEAVSP